MFVNLHFRKKIKKILSVKFTADVDNPYTQKMATYIDPLGESKQINVRQYRRGN